MATQPKTTQSSSAPSVRRERAKNGVPTALDFWCHNLDVAARFWRDSMGYDIQNGPAAAPGEVTEHDYREVTQDGRFVFGISQAMTSSTTDVAGLYFAVDDIQATADRVEELGGAILWAPMELPGDGFLAICQDPTGITFALWQMTTGTPGYAAIDELGFPCWQDCITSDVEAAATFYSGLFGYTIEPLAPGVVIAKFGNDAHFTIGPCPADQTPRWCQYFKVSDIEASVSRAHNAGAKVINPPTPLPFGVFAHLETPGGAPYGFFQATEEKV